jgi:glucosylceramidase
LGSTAKILVFDHNWEDYWYPIEVFSFLGVKEAAAGAAFHCYGGDVKQQSLFYEAVRKEVHLTECSGGEWSPDFKSNINFAVGTLAIGGTLHHAQSVLLWNLALDNKYGPHVGGCSNCRGFITGHRPDKDLENVVPQIIDGVS